MSEVEREWFARIDMSMIRQRSPLDAAPDEIEMFTEQPVGGRDE